MAAISCATGLIYFSGLITLAVGLAILNVHHFWTRDWRSIITVFGWLRSLAASFDLATSWVQGPESVITHPALVGGGAVTLALGGFRRDGLSGRLEYRQAARSSSHGHGKELRLGVAQRQASPPQVARSAVAQT
jgi:hypothetical protein